MEYRNLGRTGVKVSPLCLGCMTFGRATPVDDACKIVDRAIDAGINFFDTANVYGRGASEKAVGEALKRNKKRHSIVLATKVHGRMAEDDPNMQGNTRRHIIQQCDASLERLDTDWIDLYQIHRPQSDVPIDEMLRALDDLIRAGKINYIGTSTFGAWQAMESVFIAKELGLNRFVCEQPPYNILDRRIERELIPFAQTYGYGIIPWSPLAGGMLTGKYKRGEAPPEDARYSDATDSPRYSEGMFDVTEALEPWVKKKGCTMAQFALAWALNRPGVTSPIIGPKRMEQLEDNLGALDIEIAEEDRQKVDELVPPGQMVSPFYEADFGPHEERWF
jgi:aryl-alcohol dehydrogenase-like predicted oxidoreductase